MVSQRVGQHKEAGQNLDDIALALPGIDDVAPYLHGVALQAAQHPPVCLALAQRLDRLEQLVLLSVLALAEH